MLSFLLSLISPLSRILRTVDAKIENKTERQRVKADLVAKAAEQQTAMLSGPGKWLHALFIVPLGLWFASVCIYSMLFCRDCVLPQAWTVAALPQPLYEWSGWIVMSMFGYGVALAVFKR